MPNPVDRPSAMQQEANEDAVLIAEVLQELTLPLTAISETADDILFRHLGIITNPNQLALRTVFVYRNVGNDPSTGEPNMQYIPVELLPVQTRLDNGHDKLSILPKKEKHRVKPVPVNRLASLEECVAEIGKLAAGQPHLASIIGFAALLSEPGDPAIIISGRQNQESLREITFSSNDRVVDFFAKINHLATPGILEFPVQPPQSQKLVMRVSNENWLRGITFTRSKKNLIDPVVMLTMPLKVKIQDKTQEYIVQIGFNSWVDLQIGSSLVHTLRVVQKVAEANLERTLTGQESISQELRRLWILGLFLDLHDTRSPLTPAKGYYDFIARLNTGMEQTIADLQQKIASGKSTTLEVTTTLSELSEYLRNQAHFARIGSNGIDEAVSHIDEMAHDIVEDESFEPESVDILEVLSAVQSELEADKNARGLDITIDFRINGVGPDTRIVGLRRFIKKKIWNAYRNSKKHPADKFMVLVEPVKDSSHDPDHEPLIALVIVDNGGGINQHDLNALNNPTVRKLASQHNGMGTGLATIRAADEIIGSLSGVAHPTEFNNTFFYNSSSIGFTIISLYRDITP